MRYLSVCSGIEAASVAWHPLGWTSVGFSEIEPFPSSVLAHHYPTVPNFGDLTQHETWPIGRGSVDLMVGGTPCQSFSVAGKRGGLDDPRGQLMHSFISLAERLRPRWVVWENVPGVLSSGGGRDFGSFLGALGDVGYGWAYRVLDTQWCRVDGFAKAIPQRRRRVFVVGCLGDQRRAAQVLFESESVRRDSAKSRTTGEVSPTIPARSLARGDDLDLNGGLIARTVTTGEGGRYDGETCTFILHGVADGWPAEVANILTRRMGNGVNTTCDEGQTIVPTPTSIRRLTPTECERLMGFPDGYTLVSHRGKPAADAPRYKALGNSMTVNVVRWLGRRIEATSAMPANGR